MLKKGACMKKIIPLLAILLVISGCTQSINSDHSVVSDHQQTAYQYTIGNDEKLYTLYIPHLQSQDEVTQSMTPVIYSLNPLVENKENAPAEQSTFFKNDNVNTLIKDAIYKTALYGYGFWDLNEQGINKEANNEKLTAADYNVVYGDVYHPETEINNDNYVNYYLATQELIWEKLINPDTNLPYNINFVDIDVSKEKETILSNISEYEKTPFFGGSVINTNAERIKEPFSLVDQFGVLSRFNIVSSDNITINPTQEDNQLNFTVSTLKRDTKIQFIPKFKILNDISKVYSTKDGSYLSIGQERAHNLVSNLYIEEETAENTINLIIKTVDIDSKQEIFGAEYILSTGPEFLDPTTSNTVDNTYAIFEKIPVGTYYLQQTKAPEGYILNQEVEVIRVTSGIAEFSYPVYNQIAK